MCTKPQNLVRYNKSIKGKKTEEMNMAKLTRHEKKSIEMSMAVPAERGPVWNSRPAVFADQATHLLPQKRENGVSQSTPWKNGYLRGKEMNYYISDHHFGHVRMNSDIDCRGFADVEAMDEYMIEQWNRKVKAEDEVFILGDLTAFTDGEQVNQLLGRLAGKKTLLSGNP